MMSVLSLYYVFVTAPHSEYMAQMDAFEQQLKQHVTHFNTYGV